MLARAVTEKRTLIFCGSGGVGKTTVAAASALHAAAMGRRVLVLTIDPARRLADSLGLRGLTNDPAPVPRERLAGIGLDASGSLDAMMLDAKRALDELVETYAVNENMKEVIFSNPVYVHGAETLIGSPEYLAMEKLYELNHTGRYDLIVLDTPPTRHALDFLSAPARMVNFLEDNLLLKIFLKPSMTAGRVGLRMFRFGTSAVLRAIEKITGSDFIKAGIDFLNAFEGMFAGFKERALRAGLLLKDPGTEFIVVTCPESLAIDEALFFRQNLREQSAPFGGFVVNRVHRDFLDGLRGNDREVSRIQQALASHCDGEEGAKRWAKTKNEMKTAQDSVQRIIANLALHQEFAGHDRKALRALYRGLSQEEWVVEVPLFAEDIYDLAGLARIIESLFPNSPSAPITRQLQIIKEV